MYFEALASGGGSDWYFTILMKAPLGAAITVDDGDEEVEATGAGMDNLIGIPVHNPSSTYTISVKMNGLTAPTSNITTPATSGGISSVVEVPFAKISLTYEDNFRGQALSVSDGTHTASPSPVMPALGNSLDIYVPYTGDWTLEATDPVSGDQFNSSPNPVPVSSLDQTINAGLFVIPDGKTVLPVNDIQIWLACADIKDKTYTTLTEVLADEDTLRRLLTDDNAIDYMVRSKQFINKGLVPTMTSNTTPTGTGSVFSNPVGKDVDHEFCVFDNDSTTRYNTENGTTTAYVGFNFDVPTRVNRFRITEFTSGMNVSNGVTNQFVLEYSDDDITYTPVGTYEILAANVKDTLYFDNSSNVVAKYWRVRFLGITYTSSGYNCVICNDIQFYPYTSSIVEDELAMSYIGAYDYAADTLLSDADWAEGICNSEYFESVLNAKVPVKSADDSDILFSSEYDTADQAWHIFDNNVTTMWGPSVMQTGEYIGYKFASDVKVKKVKYIYSAGQSMICDVSIKAGNDQSSIQEAKHIGSLTYGSTQVTDEYILNDSDISASCWELYFNSKTSGASNVVGQHRELQFYGRQAAGVQTLLKAAGVDRPYTTLDELFADKEALAMVIGSHAAIDYLVTVKDWIDEFTSDETAMLFIGSDNYAADTLLADSNPNLVPVPVSISDIVGDFTNHTDYGYAFDGIKSGNNKSLAEGTTNKYIGYKFTSAKKVSCAVVTNESAVAVQGVKDCKVVYSDDNGTTWHDASAQATVPSGGSATIEVTETGSHQCWGLHCINNNGSSGYITVSELEFYTKPVNEPQWADGICNSEYFESVLNAKVPLLTSQSDPAFGGAENVAATAYFYRAFSGTNGTEATYGWLPGTTNQEKWWVGYEFANPIKIRKIATYSTMGTQSPTSFTVRGSNDGVNWTDIQTFTNHSNTTSWVYDVLANDSAYKYYSVKWNAVGGYNAGYGAKYQFYGREDVTEGVHIFSAASDTIYDQNNNVIATTDTSGHALISKSNLPNGTYTLRSTVAKDPDNLSNDFTKVVEVTDDTKAIMVMPDNALYWYGWKSGHMIDPIPLVLYSNTSNAGTMFNTQDIVYAVNEQTSKYGGAGASFTDSMDLSKFDTVKCIHTSQYVTIISMGFVVTQGQITAVSNDSSVPNDTTPTPLVNSPAYVDSGGTPILSSLDISSVNSGNIGTKICVNGNYSVNVYALWLE